MLLLRLVVLVLLPSFTASAEELEDHVPELRVFVPDAAERTKLLAHLKARSAKAFPKDAKLREQLIENVAQNLADKQAIPSHQGKTFPVSAEDVRRRVIDYELFKLETFLSSGVFPKRYFGYFDEQWDTAPYERSLRETTIKAVKAINARQERLKRPTRVTDAEIAVTFIAEGGAFLLREHQAQLNDIHPILGVGLDDIATGMKLHADLAKELDAACGTGLQQIVFRDNSGQAWLKRNMRFEEAIVGTALMWIYEKELAASKLLASEGKKLESLSVDDQFVLGSLVYNSGLTFSPESRTQIGKFTTAQKLFRASEANRKKRWPLPVLDPKLAVEHLREGKGYPEQGTDWSGMLHVLQRYGGYVALQRFTDVFDAKGMYRVR